MIFSSTFFLREPRLPLSPYSLKKAGAVYYESVDFIFFFFLMLKDRRRGRGSGGQKKCSALEVPSAADRGFRLHNFILQGLDTLLENTN